MLVYVPSSRITMLEACGHKFFDELRHPGFMLPGGVAPPPLFNFSESELAGASVELRDRLVPPHARAAGWSPARAAANVPPPHDASPYAAAYAEAYKSAEQKEREVREPGKRAEGDGKGGAVEAGHGPFGSGDLADADGPRAGASAAAAALGGSGVGPTQGLSQRLKGEAPALPGEKRAP
jgi:hypothetical protein